MQTIPLRDFQRSGASALKHPDQPAVLAGRDSEFVLFPVTDDMRDELMQRLDDLRALMLLHHGQNLAAQAGGHLVTDEEINAEIKAARRERRGRRSKK